MSHCIKATCLFLLTLASALCTAQKADFSKVTRFILPGYDVLDTAVCDFNGDLRPDVVLALKLKAESDTLEQSRPLLLLMGNPDGSFSLLARNDNVVLCKTCGGAWGDPFEGIAVKGKYFSIEHYGGSRFRWSRIITFRYDAKLGDFVLHKDAGENYDNMNPKSSKLLLYNKSGFGKTRFANYRLNTN